MKAIVNIGDVFRGNDGTLFVVTDITSGNSHRSYWGLSSKKTNETTRKVGFFISSANDQGCVGYHEFYVADNSLVLIKTDNLEEVGKVASKASTNREIMIVGKFWLDFYEDYMSGKGVTPREGAVYWVKRIDFPGYHFMVCSIKKPGIYVGYHIEQDGRATWALDEFNINDPAVGVIFDGIADPVLLRWLENTRKNGLFSTFINLNTAIVVNTMDLRNIFGDVDKD